VHSSNGYRLFTCEEVLDELGSSRFKHAELALKILRDIPLLTVTDDVRALLDSW
jgi:hypothetical protein